jgi:hypothetical protein
MNINSLVTMFAGLTMFHVALSCAADINVGSASGKKFVGDQLRAFSAEGGAIVSTRDAQIDLYYTEGAPFRLSGKVWLGGPSKTLEFPQDLPDGFALFLREWDSLHRSSLTSRSLIVKRRLVEGVKEKKIAHVADFGAPATGQWVSFVVEATPAQISCKFGEYSAVIKGPLDMDGVNKIVLAPGSKIKDMQLEILQVNPGTASTSAAVNASTIQSSQADIGLGAKLDAAGQVALTFHTVPGKTYRLQFKDDLADPTWTPLGESLTAIGSNIVVSDAATQPKRFYSVVTVP